MKSKNPRSAVVFQAGSFKLIIRSIRTTISVRLSSLLAWTPPEYLNPVISLSTSHPSSQYLNTALLPATWPSPTAHPVPPARRPSTLHVGTKVYGDRAHSVPRGGGDQDSHDSRSAFRILRTDVIANTAIPFKCHVSVN